MSRGGGALRSFRRRGGQALARGDHRARPGAAGHDHALRDGERPKAPARRHELPERHRRRHGGRDGHQPQRHHQRSLSQAHGLVERGLPRHGQRPGRRGRLVLRDLEHVVRSVQVADRTRQLRQAAGLPRLQVRRGLEVRLHLTEAHLGVHQRADSRDRCGRHHLPDPRERGAAHPRPERRPHPAGQLRRPHELAPAGDRQRPASGLLPEHLGLHEPVVDVAGVRGVRHQRDLPGEPLSPRRRPLRPGLHARSHRR